MARRSIVLDGDGRCRARRRPVAAVMVALLMAITACSADSSAVLLATTSSVEDTGLLDSLLVRYHAAAPHRVRAIAVGSGEALELGRRRDVDAVLAHAPADEERFMADGHGRARYEVFRNDYLLAGPPADPAGVRATASAVDAIAAIDASGAAFVSRGDRSGTHQKELELRALLPSPATRGSGYMEAGLGMAETLRLASERDAYTLTDRATYLSLAHALRIEPLFDGGTVLLNPYSIIIVAGARNEAGAAHFAAWLRGPEGQARVAEFRGTRGPPPFMPSAEPASNAR
jgi:tungstate transport system substrate-binding protein